MKRKWKIIFGIILITIMASSLLYFSTRGLETRLLKVTPQTIAKTFKEEGIVTADVEKLVYCVRGGLVTSLPVQEGSSVKQGDPLISIDSQELFYQLQQLQGEMRSLLAQQELERTETDLESLEKLYNIGAISQKEYQNAKRRLESDYYPGQIQSLQESINILEYQIKSNNITAPVDGIVSELSVKEGMVLNPGSQIMKLFQTNSFKVEAYVLAEDIASIEPGMAVTLLQNNKKGDITFSGTVEKISPSAIEKLSILGLKERRVKVTLNLQAPPSLDLRPGYTLEVLFTIDQQENKLVVPKTALFPYNNKEALWVVRKGQASVQPVIKGFENDRNVVIEEGLQEGDLVILNPQQEGLKEGAKVKQ